MNTKVLRKAALSLIALSMAAGCTTSARGAENIPVVEMPTSSDELPEGYEPPDRTVILSGHRIGFEPIDTTLQAPGEFGTSPLIYPLGDGVIVQFYGSTTCPPGIKLAQLEDGGTYSLQVVVNYNYAMEQDPYLMACSADIKAQAFRIFAEDDGISSEHWWLIAAETARWVDKPLFDDAEALWNEGWQLFEMADGTASPLTQPHERG